MNLLKLAMYLTSTKSFIRKHIGEMRERENKRDYEEVMRSIANNVHSLTILRKSQFFSE